jgi:Sigma-70 region 2
MSELTGRDRIRPETELLDGAWRGERRAIEQLVHDNSPRLYRIARGIIGDDYEAEDILQEAYIRAFKNLRSFRRESTLATWLSRIVQALEAMIDPDDIRLRFGGAPWARVDVGLDRSLIWHPRSTNTSMQRRFRIATRTKSTFGDSRRGSGSSFFPIPKTCTDVPRTGSELEEYLITKAPWPMGRRFSPNRTRPGRNCYWRVSGMLT